jgi:DNA invertase Pin-like site-specific DNA recombinase
MTVEDTHGPSRTEKLIAKLDRLARNARFLLSVVEGSGEAGVVFCDLPTLPAGLVGKFMLTQMAAVAELEAGLISQRTRAALAVAKARGVRLGNPSPSPATAAMAAAARQARSRQVADRAQNVLAVLRQVQAEGVSSLRPSLQSALTRRAHSGRQGAVIAGTGPATAGPLRGGEPHGVKGPAP